MLKNKAERTKMFSYPAILETDTNGQVMVTFPDIPEAATAGDSETDALHMAVDALESAIEIYFDEKRTVPAPSRAKHGQRTIALPATATAKVLLHNEMLAQGIKKSELARRLKIAPPNIERIFNIHHGTKLDTIEKALNALGKQLDMRLSCR
jgi:antitoxin HicB